MKAIIITTEQVRNSDERNYNPREWDKVIDRIMKFNNVVWYLVPKGNGYGYDRYYAEYTLPEGLRLASQISYSSTITSGGFYRFDVEKTTDDGRTMRDVFKLLGDGAPTEDVAKMIKEISDELQNSNHVDISAGSFYDDDGKPVLFGTTGGARAEMIKRSKDYGMTFTKGL